MRYNQLRAFDAVARESSFSKAAEVLCVTQPAVTLHVRALEEAYKLQLFKRSAGGVSLTPEGNDLIRLTRQMFAMEAQIGEYLSGANALKRGRLSLAADGPHIALDVVSAFRDRHPGVEVRMKLGNAELTLRDVLEQKVDAAVTANPPRDKRLLVIPIARQDMMVIVPPNHPWAKRSEIRLADLQDQPIILREVGSNTRKALDRALRKAKVNVIPILELGSREAVREAVAVGLGMGFVHERECVGDSRTVAIKIKELRATNLDTLVCLRRQCQRRSIAALIEVARDLSLLNLSDARSN